MITVQKELSRLLAETRKICPIIKIKSLSVTQQQTTVIDVAFKLLKLRKVLCSVDCGIHYFPQ